MNTIYDMQNEIDFFYHCNEFVYNHDFVIFFKKIAYDRLEYDVLNNNVNLNEKDYYEFLFD